MKTSRGRIARHEFAKRLGMGLLALLLTLQGYVSQAHFHNLAASFAANSTIDLAFGDGETAAPEQRLPGLPANLPDHHNDKCLVCHLIGLGSVSVLQPILVLQAPSSTRPLSGQDSSATVVSWETSHAPRGPPVSSVQA